MNISEFFFCATHYDLMTDRINLQFFLFFVSPLKRRIETLIWKILLCVVYSLISFIHVLFCVCHYCLTSNIFSLKIISYDTERKEKAKRFNLDPIVNIESRSFSISLSALICAFLSLLLNYMCLDYVTFSIFIQYVNMKHKWICKSSQHYYLSIYIFNWLTAIVNLSQCITLYLLLNITSIQRAFFQYISKSLKSPFRLI